MIRALGGLAATIVLMLSVVASPAHAADELGLSPDGQNWSNHLSGPLFDDPVLWVPGDVEEVNFFVRNQADDGGTLTIAVETENQQQLLREDRIQSSARVGSGRARGSIWRLGGRRFHLTTLCCRPIRCARSSSRPVSTLVRAMIHGR